MFIIANVVHFKCNSLRNLPLGHACHKRQSRHICRNLRPYVGSVFLNHRTPQSEAFHVSQRRKTNVSSESCSFGSCLQWFVTPYRGSRERWAPLLLPPTADRVMTPHIPVRASGLAFWVTQHKQSSWVTCSVQLLERFKVSFLNPPPKNVTKQSSKIPNIQQLYLPFNVRRHYYG